MTTIKLDEVRQAFVAFREESIWVQTCFNTFHSLYHGGPTVDSLLRKSAVAFFNDLNIILIEYWILIVCRLTDPARTNGNTNLTVAYFVAALKQHEISTSSIEETAVQLTAYRNMVIDARNKLVSHADKTAFLKNNILGEHTNEAVEQFIQNLQHFNDLVGEAIGEGPLDYQVTSCPGDVQDLLRTLSAALDRHK